MKSTKHVENEILEKMDFAAYQLDNRLAFSLLYSKSIYIKFKHYNQK